MAQKDRARHSSHWIKKIKSDLTSLKLYLLIGMPVEPASGLLKGNLIAYTARQLQLDK
jgi:hypothetical protein